MNSKEKRATREALKKKRTELLIEIDKLQLQLTNEEDPKKQFKYQEKIMEIGKELQNIVYNPVASRCTEKPYVFKPIIINKNIKRRNLTVEMYLNFKKRGLTDTQIGIEIGRTKNFVDRFKRENGITRESWKCEA